VKALVVGDSFCPADVFERAFSSLPWAGEVRYTEVDDGERLAPGTPPEDGIREYAGVPRQLIAELEDEEVLIVHGAPVTAAVLDASPRLRLVCCARGGPVNIDVAAAAERGIAVTTTPGKNAPAVADLTIAFLIMLARGVPQGQEFLKDGGSPGGSTFEGARFLGHELDGQALGLVGYGQVGRAVAARARAFGMVVRAFDPFLNGRGPVDAAVELTDTLEALIGAADFVSLHARATPENENLLGEAQFARFRRGAYFVNTARETLVDERALREALRSGRLAGAALDVVRPAPGPHPLIGLDGVIVTPHMAGATHETLARGARMLADELERFAAGEPLRHSVNSIGA